MTSSQHDFKSHEYDRPNQDWVCGAEASGMPCPLGPSQHGLCRAICTPRKIGDRYYCENACEAAGDCDQGPLEDGSCCQMPPQCKPLKKTGTWQCTRGQCQDGPLPDGSCSRLFTGCKPERSLLGKRRLVVMSFLGLTVGGLLIAASLDSWPRFLSPGPLTSHHHTISDCSDCHAAASGNMGRWVEQAASVVNRHEQNAGCQKCHEQQLGHDAMFAHGLSPTRLAELRQSATDTASSSSSAMLGLMRFTRGELPAANRENDCASCHTEHRGADFDIKHLSDSQCQSCHTSVFHSFNDGHPEFEGYPYRQKAHLYFDHAAHLNRHFQDARDGNPAVAAWQCVDCHQLDLAGRTMALKPYEVTCAECHDDQIHNTLNPGIAFFSLPAIDTASLEGTEGIGQWPASFPNHVQSSGLLSPLTEILLSNHPEMSEQLVAMEGLDLADLASLDVTRKQQITSWVWSFKEAWWELLQRGRLEFREQLVDVLGSNQIADDVAGQFYDQLWLAQQRWLPDLEREIRLRRSGEAVDADLPVDADGMAETEESEAASKFAPVSQIAAGWFLHDLDLSIRYRPAKHADAWVGAWLDAVVAMPRRNTGLPDTWVRSVSDRAFQGLASVAAPGRCFKCHTVIEDERRGLVIRWSARDESSLSGRFTIFDHQPHLTGMSGECRDCHSMNQSSVAEDSQQLFRRTFVQANWMPNTQSDNFVSDFSALSRLSCAKCHASSEAPESCLTCHVYHVRP